MATTVTLIPWLRVQARAGVSSMPDINMPGQFMPDESTKAMAMRVYLRGRS